MKTKVFILAACLLAMQGIAGNKEGKNSKSGDSFKVYGYATVNYKKGKEIEIKVFEENAQVQKTRTDKKGEFYLELMKNKHYVIEFSYPGTYPKRIIIDTKVADNIENFNNEFGFHCDLIPADEFAGVKDTDILDFPSAIIEFSEEEKALVPKVEYVKNYTIEVEKLLYEASLRNE